MQASLKLLETMCTKNFKLLKNSAELVVSFLNFYFRSSLLKQKKKKKEIQLLQPVSQRHALFNYEEDKYQCSQFPENPKKPGNSRTISRWAVNKALFRAYLKSKLKEVPAARFAVRRETF